MECCSFSLSQLSRSFYSSQSSCFSILGLGGFYHHNLLNWFLIFFWVPLVAQSMDRALTKALMPSDAPLNSSKHRKVGPKMKQLKNKKVGARSLIQSTSRVGGRVKVLRWH
jgi:hypothetical protein